MDGLLEARAETLQQDRGAVATRKARDGSAGVGAGARLVETLDWRSIRRPAFDRAEIATLVRRAGAAMTRSTPVGRVAAFHIERAGHIPAHHDRLGQIGRQRRERLE